METLKMLIEYIWDELDDAMKYAKKALHFKHENKALSDMFMQNSKEEMMHFERLHDQAVKCLNSHRDDHGHVPEKIHVVWEWERDKFINRAADVKRIQDMAK